VPPPIPPRPAGGSNASSRRNSGTAAPPAESSALFPTGKFVRQLQLATNNAKLDAIARKRDKDASQAAAASGTEAPARSRSLSPPDSNAADGSGSGAPPQSSSSSDPAGKYGVPTLSQADLLSEVLDWSGKGLRVAGVEGGWSLYPMIHTLILRDNELSTLIKQGIESLPNLHTLDLRRNKLTGFGDTLLVLSQCRSLKHVYLHQSTRDNVTNNVQLYVDFVFQSLRGLETCDGVQSKVSIRLNPLDQSAFEFIHLLSGGMSENQLLRCDLSNKQLPASLFFFLLSALYQLKVAWLKLDGDNEFAQLNSYTNCVIYYLGKYLLYLDEEEITHQRLHLALKAQAESKIKITKIGWDECATEALEAAREWIDQQDRLAEEREEKVRILAHMARYNIGPNGEQLNPGDPGYDPNAEAYAQQAGGGVDGDMPLTDEERAQLARTQGDVPFGMKSQTAKDQPDDATGFNLHIPGRGLGAGPMPGSVTTANSISSHNSNVGIDTQLSNKLEIFIHYLQVYGLVLISSIHINWPPAFYQFSEWVRIFTLQLDKWFSFLPFQSNIMFWVVSFFPFVLLFLFWRISRLRGNLNGWIDSYITNWSRTRRNVLLCVGTFMALGVFFALLFMGNQVYKGESINSANATAALSFVLFPLVGLLIWFLAIRKFRRGWAADDSLDKDKFRGDWLTKINFYQWLCLFSITNTFMPVARVILRQFQCICDGQGAINKGEGADPNQCYAAIDDSQMCFPDEASVTQIVALVCGTFYLVGIPIFYYNIITRTVSLVLTTSRQYKLLSMEIARLSALPKAQRAAVAKDLHEYRRIQFKLYYNIVNNPLNSVPASSLFAAYQEKYKYTKLLQMFEKVLLVVVTLFVPDELGGLDHGGQIVWAAIIIILYLGTLLVIRPYNDPLDDAMDIIAEAGNTTSILVALSIAYSAPWLSSTQANILLFVANGVIFVSFVMAFIISPARTFWRRKKREAARKAELEAEQAAMKAMVDGVKSIKEKRKSQAQLVALNKEQETTDNLAVDNNGKEDSKMAKQGVHGEPNGVPVAIAESTAGGSTPAATENGNAAVDVNAGVVRIHGEDDDDDSPGGSPEPDASPLHQANEALALELDGVPLAEASHDDGQSDHLRVQTLASPLQGAPAQGPPTFSPAGGATPHAGVLTPAAGVAVSPAAGSAASALTSPFSHTVTHGHVRNGVEQPIHVQTSSQVERAGGVLNDEAADEVLPLGSNGRPIGGRGRASSMSSTYGGAFVQGPISSSSASSTTRPRLIAQPSLQSLEALFRATSPPPMAPDISAPADDAEGVLSDARASLGGRATSVSSVGRTSFLTLGRPRSLDHPVDVAAGDVAAGAAAVLSAPNSARSAGASVSQLSVELDQDFERQFERTGNEMQRLHQLTMLKLCTPSASQYASELALDSTRSLPPHQIQQGFRSPSTMGAGGWAGSSLALPAQGTLGVTGRHQSASVGAAGRHTPLSAAPGGYGPAGRTMSAAAFSHALASANASHFGTMGPSTSAGMGIGAGVPYPGRPPIGRAGSSKTLLPPGVRPRHNVPSLPISSGGLGAASAMLSMSPRSRSRASNGSTPGYPLPPLPRGAVSSVSHIDVAIMHDEVAPVPVTPTAAAVLAKLEASASAQEVNAAAAANATGDAHTLHLNRAGSISSLHKSLSPAPAPGVSPSVSMRNQPKVLPPGLAPYRPRHASVSAGSPAGGGGHSQLGVEMSRSRSPFGSPAGSVAGGASAPATALGAAVGASGSGEHKGTLSWVRGKFATLLENEGFVPTLVTPEEQQMMQLQQQQARAHSPERMV